MASPVLSAAAKNALNQILSDAVARKSAPAMFLGVTTVDGPIYVQTAGTTLVDDPTSPPIDEDTVFALFSQTKLITTIAALQLVEQGKISLDTPVESVLPELANPVVATAQDETGRATTTVPAKNKITLRQLLNHTSGLDYRINGALPLDIVPPVYKHNYTDDEDSSKFFKIIQGSHSGVPLRFEPGTNFVYGFSTDCAGYVVERLSGKFLEQYFQDHIFGPLGMTSTSFCLTPPLQKRLLPLSHRTAGAESVKRWNRPPMFDRDPAKVRVPLGGIGLYGSQKDYLKLLTHVLQIKAGSANAPILSRASVESMFTPSLESTAAATFNGVVGFVHPYLGLPPAAAQFGHGLLVNTADVPGKRRSGSGCWSGMAMTSYWVDPATGVAVIFATQLLPGLDNTHERLYDLVEREVYAGLSTTL
ncbi:beta-lactamase [Mycena albidolilacea]|uniref:Beta-lactamase n=1 Tax=Mycena albidolilacea TaxID=1033008 RepID=A0AAD7APK3_9AGAR|nr:beta-lactamase [Mycena albidolilacea]